MSHKKRGLPKPISIYKGYSIRPNGEWIGADQIWMYKSGFIVYAKKKLIKDSFESVNDALTYIKTL